MPNSNEPVGDLADEQRWEEAQAESVPLPPQKKPMRPHVA